MPAEKREISPSLRPTRAVIDTAALAHNLAEIRRVAPGRKVLGVVKADAYGHGAAVVGPALERAGIDWLGVALVEEGLELREVGVETPVLVLDGCYGDGYDLLLAHRLTPVVYRDEHLEALAAAARRANTAAAAHLKVDTGMGRLGVAVEDVAAFGRKARELGIRLEGLCSHLANADLGDEPMARRQLEGFERARAGLAESGHAPVLLHLANSAATLELAEARLDLVRPGLLLYGRVPAPRLEGKLSLRPVLSWTTQIVQLRDFPAGAPISYGGTFETARPSRIAVLPVGYADGYRRGFSHKVHVLVEGRRAPVVGLVTMDLCMVDVTDVPAARVGSEVVLLGRQGAAEIPVSELSAAGATIDYEIFCGIGARVPRVPRA